MQLKRLQNRLFRNEYETLNTINNIENSFENIREEFIKKYSFNNNYLIPNQSIIDNKNFNTNGNIYNNLSNNQDQYLIYEF